MEGYDAKDMKLVELGLRLVIGQAHHNACMARMERRAPEIIARLDKEYEESLETYRRIVGREPTAG